MEIFKPHLERIRDVELFRDRIEQTPDRLVVEGTRGKSSTVRMLEELIRGTGRRTLAKITGEAPELIYNGTEIPIFRENDTILLDYDNIPSVVNFEVDAIIYENQAITPYTMRYIHRILQPTHVIIPNIRIDHVEGLGKDLAEMTENFAKNLFATTFQKQVYYTEPIRKVHDLVFPILREFADANPDRAVLYDVAIPPECRKLPGIENISISAFFMENNYGATIEIAPYIRRIKKKLRIRENKEGIRYFNAAKINDPISFIHMLTYILRDTDEKIALLGYLRKDRAGRNDIFEDFFIEVNERFGDRIGKMWLSGYSTDQMYRSLPASLQKITDAPVDSADIDAILGHVKEHGLILVPMMNRVNPFMDAVVARLEDTWHPEARGRYHFDPVTGLVREPAGSGSADDPPEHPPA
jgi:hypothetical protein